MDVPLTRTKILLPRRSPNLLTRQRLLDLLYDLLDYRLVIIAAPAGYGKTSLLVDLAHQVDMPVCWYTLDTLDQDPQRFVAHLVGAIAERFPGFGKQSTTAWHDATSPHLDVDQLVSVIVNEAYERIREHFVIVLDDYHLIGDDETINHLINQFVQKVDENCHLVISSRALLSLPDLPLMVARSQVGGLALGELAFRAEEIQALMLQNYHVSIPASEAQRLVQETEGWITGLLLSAQTMEQGMADRTRIARVSGVGLYDYLAQQVLDQQTAPLRDFLLRTSLMEEFDAGLCEAVLGSGEDWHRMMDSLLQNNLFVLPVDDGGTWLRYHHLFRDFMQARLAQEQPAERDRILRRLARVLAAREEWERAHAVCQRLGDVAVTADLIEQAGSPMIKNGQWTILAGWLDALPEQVLSSRPPLVSLRGYVAVMLGETSRGLALLNQAEVALRKTGDLPQLARTLVRRATAHRFVGRCPACLADAAEALSLADGDESLRSVRAEALKEKGLSSLRMGQLNQAIEWLEQSLFAYSVLRDEQNVATLRMDLGLSYASVGRHAQALTHYGRALEHWRKTGNVAQQANLLNNLGLLHHLKGDYEAAGAHLEQALHCARRTGYARMEALTLSSIGDLYTDLDAPKAALDAYHQARVIAQRIDYRFLLLYLDLAQTALSRSSGDLLRAHLLLESAQRSVQSSHSTYEQGLWELEAGRIALAERNASLAITHLENAIRFFEDGGQPLEATRSYVYLAMACQANEDEKAALAYLSRALSIVSNLESEHSLVVAIREARTLLEVARGDAAIGPQALRLLRQIAEFERNIPALRRRLRRQMAAVPFAPPRLTFKALGCVEVMVGERRVTRADWQAQVARDLLFCLLAHTNGMTRETIGVIFWPDKSPAQLKLQFKQTIYRLRRALGQDVVLLDEERYYFNRNLDYEYDVDAFWAQVQQARRISESGARAEAYRQAVELYKGAYLPRIDGDWIYAERERLWRTYVEAVLGLAEFQLEAHDYAAALDSGQRILAEDSSCEEAHRLVMRVYGAMGDRAAVARQLERCRQVLWEEANAPLSPQTEALYERLTRH